VLIRALGAVFQDLPVRVLLDSWYMRQQVIEYALAWGFEVIGQVRRDTALYALPQALGSARRGRRRVYGLKYTPAQVAVLPEYRVRLWLYGQRRWVRYRSVQAKARFLHGRLVRAVWVQFEDEQGQLTTPRLVLATEADLRPTVIILAYARRWAVESMFCQVKHAWGWAQAWQQSRQVLARWVQILSVSYALPQALALCGWQGLDAWAALTPWRLKRPLTAGRVRLGLQRLFAHVNVRAWWDPKCRQFRPPERTVVPTAGPVLAKAA
jgi:hypothetical protein